MRRGGDQYIRYWRAVAPCLCGSIGLALVTLICFRLGFNLATTVCLYLVIVVLQSLQGSFFSSAVVSLIAVGCLAYYFAAPIFSFRVDDPLNAAAIVVFFTTSAVITHLVSRVRKSGEQEFNVRLKERVSERTRIAGELHDTLLQSVQGLVFRLQAAESMLPARPGDAKLTLERALDDAAQAIADAQDAVQELRSSTVVTYDLAAAVTALGTELAVQHTTDSANEDTTFLVAVEGTPQDLHPILRDEIYRIEGKALRNAFRARAQRIEVEFRYDQQQLRVLIRDDASSTDPSVVISERANAKKIGAHLDFRSVVGGGTEVDLRVPASIAYRRYAGRGFRLFGKAGSYS